MTLMKWDPFRNVAALQDRINRIFDETFPRNKNMDEEIDACAWKPAVDVYEDDEGFVMAVDLPGVDKADVSVELKENILNIKGFRKAEKEIEPERFYRQERCFGTFHRSFRLQSPVDPGNIKAKFKDGVLEIYIPKPKHAKTKKIDINAE